eukprot:TRINITY_DN765_c0_g1_i1.p1 TRINITY_DN765_c0_g1~~TRINITY_DN765_c0_g1_i1.p1  ORF type:complete len:126 (-),score=27.01 TRINITY_DN765_c0_g1_i1:183-560(-)
MSSGMSVVDYSSFLQAISIAAPSLDFEAKLEFSFGGDDDLDFVCGEGFRALTLTSPSSQEQQDLGAGTNKTLLGKRKPSSRVVIQDVDEENEDGEDDMIIREKKHKARHHSNTLIAPTIGIFPWG